MGSCSLLAAGPIGEGIGEMSLVFEGSPNIQGEGVKTGVAFCELLFD